MSPYCPCGVQSPGDQQRNKTFNLINPCQVPRPTPAQGSRLRKTQGGGLERLLLSCEGAAPVGPRDRSQTPRGKWLLGSWGPSEGKSWGAGWRGQSDPQGKAEWSSKPPWQPVFCTLRPRCSFSSLEPISGFAQSRLTDEPGESETQVRGEGETLLAQCRHKAQPGQVPLPPPPVGVVTWVYRPANKPAEMSDLPQATVLCAQGLRINNQVVFFF